MGKIIPINNINSYAQVSKDCKQTMCNFKIEHKSTSYLKVFIIYNYIVHSSDFLQKMVI